MRIVVEHPEFKQAIFAENLKVVVGESGLFICATGSSPVSQQAREKDLREFIAATRVEQPPKPAAKPAAPQPVVKKTSPGELETL